MNSEIIEKLKKVSLFEPLKDDLDALTRVAGLMKTKQVAAGKPIITENEEGDEMFILFHGTVEICKKTLAGENYTVVKLSAEQNAFFGELALIDNDRRSATVIAATNCELLTLNKDAFLKLGDQDSRIGLTITRRISQILSQRLRRANQDTVTLYEALVGEIEEST